MTFGEALAEAIRAKALSIAVVARSVGCTASNISAILAGRNSMVRDPDIVRRLEEAVGVGRGTLVKYLPAGHPSHTYYDAEATAEAIGVGPPLPVFGVADGGVPHGQEPGETGATFRPRKYPPGAGVVTVSGWSVSGFGIWDGDRVAVEKTLVKPDCGLVVYHNDEGFVCKLWKDDKAWRFGPGDAGPVEVPLDRSTRIFGVVLGVVEGERTGELPKPAKPGRRK